MKSKLFPEPDLNLAVLVKQTAWLMKQIVVSNPGLSAVLFISILAEAVFPAGNIYRINNASDAYFEIERAGKTEQLPVRITFVSPEILTTEKVFKVWAEIDNSARLFFPGMKGSLHVKLRPDRSNNSSLGN